MAGTRGPVPKRSSQRRRTNAPDMPITQAAGAAKVPVPKADPDWHPTAKRIYQSLRRSGQAAFYEPSDWAAAYLIAESISRDLNPQFVGVTAGPHSEPIFESIPLKGASLAAYLKAFGALLMTEGDRRRARVELEREVQVDEDDVRAEATVTALYGDFSA